MAIVKENFYKVFFNTTDVSEKVREYLTPSVDMVITAAQFMYVGLYKPFRQFYIEFDVANPSPSALTFEYFDGNNWVVLPNVIDETDKYIESGFITFPRPTDWKATTIETVEKFYIRVSSASDLGADMKMTGLNVLFSNDLDLIGVRENIVSKLNDGNSWVAKHEAARKLIIQKLNASGNVKIKRNDISPLFVGTDDPDTKTFSDLTQFDFIEPFQLREASKFYALSFIYLDELSDEEDDKWERAGVRHEARADEAFNVFRLTLDTDDDGEEDSDENVGTTRSDLTWA